MIKTKRELAEEASALGAQLGVEVDTARKNHAQLTELVEGLRAQVSSGPAESDPPSDDRDLEFLSSTIAEARHPEPSIVFPAPQKQPEQPEQPTPAYVIADGRSVACKRGTVRAGDRVRAKDFSGGQKTLSHLVKIGVVVKR